MIERPFWIERIHRAWKEAPIVWLSGVRRSGKTTLVQNLNPDSCRYFNCDLPSVEEMLSEPELFFKNCRHPLLIFDEVHQLKDPSRLLKIGADAFPQFKMIATGSSTLGVSRKFRDTLTGRKREVHLVPVLWDEISAFGNATLEKRLYHGGLPPMLLSEEKQSSFFREWTDSFFARDIQKLFEFRDVDKFTSIFEYIMKQSGGLFEVSRTASALGISRITVENHLRALEMTHAVYLLRPFHGGGKKEVIRMPKCYGFDTGFVSFFRGWDPLRSDDYGILWEHLVLEYLQAKLPYEKIHYWRDREGREIDFVIPRRRDHIDAIECKWKPSEFDFRSLKTFRAQYPKGNNYLVSPGPEQSYYKTFGALKILICNPHSWHETFVK